MASEFDLIKTFFQPLSGQLGPSEIGIGDDGAVLTPPENHQMVVVTDTLVAGVHFPEDSSAYDIAWKALAVNLSDLAAMGATPGFYSLALTLPENNSAWLSAFAQGLADLAGEVGISLIGGDTTKGPLTITVTANGWVKTGKAVLRSTAQNGDQVFVSNTLGDGALGLKLALNTLPDKLKALFNEGDKQFLLAALNRPQPQLPLVPLLQEHANSAIDISDGFVADLKHILEKTNELQKYESNVSAQIELQNLPLSLPMQKYIEATDDWSLVLAGGDDYQLCFSVPVDKVESLKNKAEQQGCAITHCGFITYKASKANNDNQTIDLKKAGQPFQLQSKGYLHF